MTDKELGDIIKKALDNYQPEYEADSWDSLSERLDADEAQSDDAFDQSVKAAMSGFVADESESGWTAMERRLEESEHVEFDDAIRDRVENYTEPYDSSSWPVLDDKIDQDVTLRRRLRIAKILEVVAVLLLILTAHNLKPEIRELISGGEVQAGSFEADRGDLGTEEHMVIKESAASSQKVDHETAIRSFQSRSAEVTLQQKGQIPTSRVNQSRVQLASLQARQIPVFAKRQISAKDGQCDVVPDVHTNPQINEFDVLNTLGLSESIEASANYPVPVPKRPRGRRSLRLTIGASVDVNSLYLPGDQFYTASEKVNFSERTLAAMGYSTGAGIIFDRGKWSFETGLYYSSKQYEPNRVLQIGKAFDVRTLDFEKISLHVISVPMQAYWNFDRKGKTRFYAVGGAGFNLIASANYDLLTRRNTRSAPPGGGNNRTDLEVSRVKEHILDGAEFSSKSYVTVVGGFGVEHYLNRQLSVFTQPTFNYQIPFFHFSDQNGKHLQYLSLQVGTRIRLQ